MQSTQDLKQLTHLPQAQDSWDALLEPRAARLAFADPAFLLSRETRGIRFQLELLKANLALQQHGIHRTVVVFGGARFIDPDSAAVRLADAQVSGDPAMIAVAKRHVRNAAYYAQARAFATIVARYSKTCTDPEDKLTICTGGGPGVMEAANRGADDVGEPSVGLNISLPHEQTANPYVSPHLCFQFHYFALRKMHFLMRAAALVAFPGGFGTLDELFEVLTLVQTGKAMPVPIVLYGRSYWQRLLNFDVLVEEGAISPEDIKLFSYADTPAEAWQALQPIVNKQ